MNDAKLNYLFKQLSNSVEYINDKIFSKATNTEITNVPAYICSVNGGILKPADINNVISILSYYNEPEKRWPDLPIVTKAKKLGAITSNEGSPFDLDDKQYQILNILLYHPQEEVMFITCGVGGSGKSTYLNIVRQIFNDCSNASLSDLSNPFVVAEAVKHRLICSDELSKGDIDCKVLKQLVSKQPMIINPKNMRPHEIISNSGLFYCCNKAPKIDVTDTGILRRIIYYERNTVIKNPNVWLKDKKYTEEELLWFCRRALAFENVNWRDQFLNETHKYLMKENSVYLCGMGSATYENYKEQCKSKGYKAYSENNYYEIKNLFKTWMEDGKKEPTEKRELTAEEKERFEKLKQKILNK